MPGSLEQHLLALDRARAGHDHDLVVADLEPSDVDDGVVTPELPARELEGLGDGDDLLDAAEVREGVPVGVGVAADDADDRPLLAPRQLGLEPDLLDALDDRVDLGFGRLVRHDDDHGREASRSALIASAPRRYAKRIAVCGRGVL